MKSMSLFDNMAEQSAKIAEQQREVFKTNSSFVFSKILGEDVKIYEKSFISAERVAVTGGAKATYTGKVTDVYPDYIVLDNKTLVSTKWISSIEIL